LPVGENGYFVGENQDGTGLGMGQPQDREEAQQRYEEARTWQATIIDNPDYTVSVDEYRKQLADARKAVARAHKAFLAASIG